ncbi:glycine--tRNA ligase subunit beta [Candidatus Bipolaricaulota sp. J31]
MPEFLLEVGTEELPALDAPRLAEALGRFLSEALAAERLGFEALEIFWTPRRLTVLVRGLAERQADLVEEVRGPAVAVGLDADGRPTQAALGFLRKYGASPEDLLRKKVGDKEYLFLEVRTSGKPAREVLMELIPRAIRSLPCRKMMRWDSSGIAFLRPIRWLVCLLDGEVLPVKLGNLEAGRVTRGHRFFGPKEVPLDSPGAYVETLRAARVVVDPKEREEMIREAAARVEEEHGVRALWTEGLLGTIAGSLEWPAPVEGEFPAEFLDLPAPVIAAVLHEEGKFVPFARDGAPASVFLGFRDGKEDEKGYVRQGYERVVKARLRDARFFFENDLKRPLAERVLDLRGVVYEARLGTVWDKVQRIREICRRLVGPLGLEEEGGKLLDRAAFLCKADLTTEMVKEFPELEGVMGGIYARISGEPEEVAAAIEEHLLPRTRADELPSTRLGTALSLADKLDTVMGAILIGEVPTGSRDPYGIRRAANALISLILRKKLVLDLFDLVNAARDLYPQLPGGKGPEDVKAFLLERLRHILRDDYDIPHDVAEAVLAVPRGDFFGLLERAQALASMRGEAALAAVAQLFERLRNITGDHADTSFDPELFQQEEERELWRAYLKAEGHLRRALEERDYVGALRALLPLGEPIHRYFERVFVMVDDEKTRMNRLSFLRALLSLFLEIGDLSKLVT